NFGINQQPISKDKNESEQINPGQNRTVVVPTLEISDKEDGVPTVVTITKLPDNGTLYYNEKSVSANVAISDFDNSKLTIDPIDGNQLIKFEYTSTDKAGFESEKAVVYMPFVGLMISGNVFDDGNGDGNVNGTPISQIKDTQLFVNLLDTNNKLISSYSLNTTGNYYFDGNDKITANTNYRLVLTTDSNGTTALLPEDWNNKDGENIGLTGLDGLSNGVIDVNLSTKNIDNINFGINERPTTQNVSSDLAINPNSIIQVVDLLPEDREDGTPKIVTINTLPTAGVLYYDNRLVVAGENITDFNNSKLMVKPNNDNIAIVFTYSAIDSTGWSSGEPSRVRMPFYVPITNEDNETNINNNAETTDSNNTGTIEENEEEANSNNTETIEENEEETNSNNTETVEENEEEANSNNTETIEENEEETNSNNTETVEENEEETNSNNTETVEESEEETNSNNTETVEENEEQSQIEQITLEENTTDIEQQPLVIYNLDVTDDRVKANTQGASTVINVLSNDAVENDVRILLVNIKDGEVIWDNGTAVGGTNIQTTDNLIIPGEGTWSVEDDGNIIFTAEDGFKGTPTPVYYLVEDQTGNRSNIAEVEIITDCTCDTYVSKGTHDSVVSLKIPGIITMIIFQIFMLILFIRKEEKIA
ncbi:MAG: hypothetical protein GXO60_09895, partial [Epsilonproteobacteria bacterium]|nr:hypothetical protein [Campylobacterota bacterium]